MYRCEICNKIVEPRTRCQKIVVKTRATEYPSRPKANKLRVGRKNKHFDDPGGAGYEIAKEALACRQCAQEHEVKVRAAEEAGDYGDEEELTTF